MSGKRATVSGAVGAVGDRAVRSLALGLQRAMRSGNSVEPTAPRASTFVRGARVTTDIRYGDTLPNSHLDIYVAGDDPTVSRPTVVIVHGGGFVAGSKSDGDPNASGDDTYFALGHGPMLDAGYNLVSIDYALAPQYPYPSPLRQLDEALCFLVAEGPAYGLDLGRVVLSGGSAGGHIVGQYANLLTNPAHAAQVGITPSIEASTVRAMILDSAPFDPYRGGRTQTPKLVNNLLFGLSVRAYLGAHPEILDEANLIDHVTSDFPPAVIADGNTGTFPDQARDFADRLTQLGVDHELILHPRSEAELDHGFMAQASRWTDDYNRRKLAFVDAAVR